MIQSKQPTEGIFDDRHLTMVVTSFPAMADYNRRLISRPGSCFLIDLGPSNLSISIQDLNDEMSKPAKTTEDRPNILVLMADEHRWDAMGCSGNSKIRTPYLDQLASSGTRFSQCVCTTPVCVASRMAFITGKRNGESRQVANKPAPGDVPELPTFPQLLQRSNYWTQGIGKMHFHGRHFGLRGLLTMEECVSHYTDDDYLRYLRAKKVRTRFPNGIRDLLQCQPQTSGIPLKHSPNEWVAERSVEFLHEHTRTRAQQPFFLWSSWIAPHPPFAPCSPYDEMYDSEDMDLPTYPDQPVGDIPSTLWPNRMRLDGAHLDPERIKRIRSLYYGQVSHVDNAIGRVLNEIDRLGLNENTVVLYFSDHGEMLGDHGMGLKSSPYEPSVRIPMILRWPGRTATGSVCDDLVTLTDFFPTLVSELKIEYPGLLYGELAGQSLLGIPGGGLATPREETVIDFGFGKNRWIAVRSRNFKYSLYAADDGREELYDLSSDPNEMHNLATEKPDETERLRSRALEWERRCGLPESFDGKGRFQTYPRPKMTPSEEECRGVILNEGPWPKRLPADEADSIESYSEAFTRAIAKETCLSPEKLSLHEYKKKIAKLAPDDPGGEPLTGTPWEDAWEKA